MSEQEKQLHEFKRLVDAAAANANDQNDLGVNLINNVSGEFEDYVALQKLNEKRSTQSGFLQWFNAILVWPFKIPGLLNFGPPSADPITRNFIHALGNRGEINRAQIRILNVYNMIRLEPNGACLICMPSKENYLKAQLMFGMLFILTPLLALVVWQVSTCILPGLPFGFLVGAVLGLLWRDVYNLAWGREKLAKYIISRYPWFRTVDSCI